MPQPPGKGEMPQPPDEDEWTELELLEDVEEVACCRVLGVVNGRKNFEKTSSVPQL